MNITQEVLEVAVLIPYYNNLSGLIKSLCSIKYKAGKCSVVIVDDGSDILLTQGDLLKAEPTIVPFHIITLEKNRGIIGALNTGLKWIKENLQVDYIARLDCGDVCHEERFYKQLGFLHCNPEVALVGSWCIFQDPVSLKSYSYVTPTTHEKIVQEMYLRNAFIHPSIVLKTSILDRTGLYSSVYEHVEDYALFWTILNNSKGAIIDEFLVTCEINSSGISMSHRKKQLLGRRKVIQDFGSNKVLKQFGLLKLKVLLMLPYRLILETKYWFSK